MSIFKTVIHILYFGLSILISQYFFQIFFPEFYRRDFYFSIFLVLSCIPYLIVIFYFEELLISKLAFYILEDKFSKILTLILIFVLALTFWYSFLIFLGFWDFLFKGELLNLGPSSNLNPKNEILQNIFYLIIYSVSWVSIESLYKQLKTKKSAIKILKYYIKKNEELGRKNIGFEDENAVKTTLIYTKYLTGMDLEESKKMFIKVGTLKKYLEELEKIKNFN